MDSDSDDDYVPALSAEAYAALMVFQQEQEANEVTRKEAEANPVTAGDVLFEENWQLSQFWYSEETAKTLADVAEAVAGEGGAIACISCPTTFRELKRRNPTVNAVLFEYDERFGVLGGFEKYDYNFPFDLPCKYNAFFDVLLVDPPFLSEECLKKTAETVRMLRKPEDSKILLCTGIVMKDLAESTLQLRECEFKPSHKKNLGLGSSLVPVNGVNHIFEEVACALQNRVPQNNRGYITTRNS